MKLIKLNPESTPAYLERIEEHANFFLICLRGKLSTDALERDRHKMTEVIETVGLRKKSNLCDFGEVTHSDTATVAALVKRLSEFRKQKGSGRKMIFFNVHNELRSLFEITRLSELFMICESREQAEAELAPKRHVQSTEKV